MYTSVLVTALLAVSGTASPLRTIASKRHAADAGFSLSLQHKTNAHKVSGSAVVDKTYRKFRGTRPDPDSKTDISNKFRVNAATGTVPADPTTYDQEYLADVYVGAQKLSLDLDSGSSDFWVYSSELTTAQQSGHDVYNPNKSSTAHHLANQTWQIQYGDGSSASGDVWTDCVWIGGTVVEKQAIETANEISASFEQDVNSDGILGLGFDALNNVIPNQQSTFLTNAITQGLPQPVFTADLKYHAAGSYDFGYVDESKYSGSLSYVPVDSTDGYWRINTTGFGYRPQNGTAQSYDLGFDSIVDTGTSIMFVANNIALYYWALVPSSSYDYDLGGYVFACSDANTLPDLTINIGDYTAIVKGSYLAYAPASQGSDQCYGGVQSDEGLPFQILGDVFLKAVFAVFDAGRNGDSSRLGFADKAS